jgi:type II secretory pathway component PulF
MATTPATAAQLTAVLEEIAALVRARVPLDRGLVHLGRDLGGRPGELMQALAKDLERGESLTAALAAQGDAFPPVFRAVVEAGVRSGQLAPAVEGLVGLARRLAELRRTIRLALAYPIFLVLLAYGLLMLFVIVVAPPLADALHEGIQQGTSPEPPLVAVILRKLPESLPYWGVAFPAALLAVMAFCSRRISRGGLLQPGATVRLLSWMPWVGRLLRLASDALATDVLAILLERGLPLPEAVTLAAQAVGRIGKPSHVAAGERLVEHLRRGLPPERAAVEAAGLPGRVAWLLRGAFSPEARLTTLRRMADGYRRQADDLADAARLWLPVVLTLVIGGGVAILYALTLFVPWVQMIWRWIP